MLILRKITTSSTTISMQPHAHMLDYRDLYCKIALHNHRALLSSHCSTLLRSGIQGDAALRALAAFLHTQIIGSLNVSSVSIALVQKGQRCLCSTLCDITAAQPVYLDHAFPMPVVAQP